MHFSTSPLAVIGLVAQSTLAATCFPQSGCKSCASFQQIQDLKTNFCATKSNLANTPEQFNAQAHAQVFGGPIGDGNLCVQAFDNIVDQCFTRNDGGDFNFNGWDLKVGFCSCD